MGGVWSSYTSWMTVLTNTVNLTGLMPGTIYQYQVRSKCYGNNFSSDHTTSSPFMTLSSAFVIEVGDDLSELEVNLGTDKKDCIIEIFPNPSTGIFTARVTTELNEIPMEIVVTDGLGRVLQIYRLILEKGVNQQEIDLGKYPNSLYFIQLKTNMSSAHYPLIKSGN